MKDILHFSHANGFPALTYRTLFAELADDFDVRYVERIGHGGHYPITRDWSHLVEQLLDDVERRYEQPVWLVGHSLGGYLSLMAALKQPQLVKGVVLLDSPVLSGWRSSALQMLQWSGLDDRFSKGAVTRARRTHWPSREEAWKHFHRKPAFARWDERMLSDYIDYGIPQTGPGGERTLAFDREIEYRIYKTVPCTLGARVAHGAPLPIGFLAGTRSREVRHIGLDATRRLVHGRIEWVDGTHLFPMERPIETARAVQHMIATLRGALEKEAV